MDQIIEFVINHWALWLALVAILVALFITEAGINLGGVKSISPQEAVNLINHNDAVVIDIRSAEEFSKGRIIDSQNIPQADLAKKQMKLDKYKSKLLIIVDANGHEAAKIAASLKKQGFEQISFIKNGINGWSMVDLPLTSEK